uniref:EF-hand domain-containing protein n=1 Tax=Nelumbo nucifera TaxID=4432 RepID=A0A822XRI4_NELNU|nr:TPA_asm: hypothetical protein HUJ06_023039 [Nelumbo nucifera]
MAMHGVLAPTIGNEADFMKWLKSVDTNNDGHISKEELQKVLKGQKFWFPGLRAGRALGRADLNHNGVIDIGLKDEVAKLKEYAKFLGINIPRSQE